LLDLTGAASICKTSGKRGLNIYVPFGRKYTFHQAQLFSDLTARLVHRRLPGLTSLDSRPEHRRQLPVERRGEHACAIASDPQTR